ncbi:DnaT-like ssDNA-binding domain-containing protein [Pantoea dispersa]|uniref:DnaT-like ssDNA-binding domain-containing protein n=1 Tax=Pantoea dispersa TaxID=59814 RepID=UPI0035B54990
MIQGGSAHAPRGGQELTPEPVTLQNQPLNLKTTHTARSNFVFMNNCATALPHECNNPPMHTGDGGKTGTCSSAEPPAAELKTRPTQPRHKNPVLPDTIERLSTLIALDTGNVQLCVNQPAPCNKHVSDHISDKFVMFDGWRPSSGLRDTARKIRIELLGPPDQSRLADFITFWEADGAAYNQIQWELKLARYIEKGRKHLSSKRSRERRDYTLVADMDYAIPEGFRGG